ncbi:MAG TPA: phosphotransferase, partial [Kribbella sp.]|nr:phosphotransferase [Kribbella sp.]
MDEVRVVVAHTERAAVRVGDLFLKVDPDQARIDREVENMTRAPVPTPEILWREPPVLALGAVPGTVIGRLGQPSAASPAAWAAAGAALRRLHDAPPPPWAGRAGHGPDRLAGELDDECDRLVV